MGNVTNLMNKGVPLSDTDRRCLLYCYNKHVVPGGGYLWVILLLVSCDSIFHSQAGTYVNKPGCDPLQSAV